MIDADETTVDDQEIKVVATIQKSAMKAEDTSTEKTGDLGKKQLIQRSLKNDLKKVRWSNEGCT